MAEKDFTTIGDELIQKCRAIRGIGDLLGMAADTYAKGRDNFLEDTLSELGNHLTDLATEALVILRYEDPPNTRRPGAPEQSPPAPTSIKPKSQKKCPKAGNGERRFCPICFPDVVQADMDQLGRLGDCLQTLAQTQELMEEKTLEVTTDQLRSWAFLCHHIATWVPENLHGAAVGQEGGA